MKMLSPKELIKLLNSNAVYVILSMILKKLKALSNKLFFFTTMFGFINT
ncbi:hypothetical protein LEP1GSC161_1438 [Leptospira santarosai str. CBC1416]|uniref:Uncharacterized protein n=1 Tax=Leptospira santarosai str. CBC1416 TaxID=1193059 RepID=M6VI49_9LEPT|nr:hypothetical protein LEP1GSC161_1438 [Leptospira santarosai str. CBC1416]